MKVLSTFNYEYTHKHAVLMDMLTRDFKRDFEMLEVSDDKVYVSAPGYLWKGSDGVWHGDAAIYMFETSVEDQRNIRSMVSAAFGPKSWKRTFDEATGQFSWRTTIRYGYDGETIEVGIVIPNTSAGACTVTVREETITRKVYTTDCKPEQEEEPSVQQEG